MQTIIEKFTGVSRFIFEDDAEIILTDTSVITPLFIVGDISRHDVVIVKNVTPPEDWQCGRYQYSVNGWTEVFGWVEPTTPTQE